MACSGGTYDATGASCVPGACTSGPTLADPLADYAACSALVSGQTCAPVCPSGYTASGTCTLACVGLQYDTSGTSCVGGQCSLGAFANADARADYAGCLSLRTGQVCVPVCAAGYTLSGAVVLTCVGGRFDAAGATCRPNACALGPVPGTADPRGDYSACGSLVSGQTCQPVCGSGYTPSAAMQLVCDASQRFDASASTCAANGCGGGPSAGADANADYTACSGMATGQVCSPVCASGWTTVGTFVLACGTSFTYNATGAYCTANQCNAGPSLNVDAVAVYSACNLLTTGSLCTPACPLGYAAYGSFSLVCSGAGYDARGAACVPNPCGGGPSGGGDGRAEYSQCDAQRTGDLCIPNCQSGYTALGSFTLLCSGSQYDASGAICTPNTCAAGPAAGDAKADYSVCSLQASGDTCVPRCAPGYTVAGNFTLLCPAAVQYSTAGAVCSPNPCSGGVLPDQQMDEFAVYGACDALRSGDSCAPSCNDTRYSLLSSFQLVCVGGRYSASGRVCSDCTKGPTAAADPRADFGNCSRKRTGDACTAADVSCQPGYTPTGSFALSCGGVQYDAAGVTCAPNPCVSGPSTGADPRATYTDCSANSSGDLCTPTCAEGYSANGSFTLQCEGLRYDASAVSCIPNSCLGGPVNADAQADYSACTSGVTGEVCAVACGPGFAGPNFRPICGSDRRYDASAATCTAAPCAGGPISGTAAAGADYAQCNLLASGDVCAPLCVAGQESIGTVTLLCIGGQYNASAAACQPTACTSGPAINADPQADYGVCSARRTGDVCEPTCAAGWSVVGSFVLLCTGSGYDASGAVCRVNACSGGPSGNADALANYTVCNSLTSGQECSPVCPQGWMLEGTVSLTCGVDGRYDATGAKCSATECDLGPRLNAQPFTSYQSCNRLSSGQVCVPDCAAGYSVAGSFVLRCEGRQYDAAGASCAANLCSGGPYAGSDPSANYDRCLAQRTGDRCQPLCADGFTADGTISLNCSAAGFDAAGVACRPNACASGPRSGTDGFAFYAGCNGMQSGQVCRPSCLVGYTLTGSFTLVCSAAGFYDAAGAVCLPTPCGAGPYAGADAGAVYTACDAMQTGDTCVPTCASGFVVSGSFRLVCSAAGYNATGATCLPQPCNGGPVDAQAGVDYTVCSSSVSGQTCTPTCPAGSTLVGSLVLSCDASGRYSTSGSACVSNTSLPCVGGPAQAARNADYSECNALYTGRTCEVACEAGYARTAGRSFMLVCVDGQYADQSGVDCEANQCRNGPRTNADGNGSYALCNVMSSGGTCAPSCSTGYTTLGSFTLRCSDQQTYDAAGGVCMANVCGKGPEFGADPLASYGGCNRLRSGQTCRPECAAGYTLRGSFLLLCGADGGYDATGAVCTANTCRGGPSANVDGNADYTGCSIGVTGSTCAPRCTVGVLTGSIRLVCVGDGFDAAGAYCAVTCGSALCPPAGQCFTTECSGNQCTQRAKADGAACTDSDPRTVGDSCRAGVCRGTQLCLGRTCPAATQCHLPGECAPETGECSVRLAADGTSCDDGSSQTVMDVCTAGVCAGRGRCTGAVCTADDSCHTAGVCDPATGMCSTPRVADGTACDDGDSRTTGDVCRSGVCVGTLLCGGVPCQAPASSCAMPVCDGSTCQVASRPDGQPCNDEDPLTVNDTCSGRVCAGRSLCAGVACVAASQCHFPGQCEPSTGRCSTPQRAAGTRCDDGNAGTIDDTCRAGVCSGVSRCDGVTCVPAQCSAAAVCDTATGLCVQTPSADGSDCNDGDAGTINDICVSGSCRGSVACGGASCSTSEECYRPACDGSSCVRLARPDGTACDDGLPNTNDDKCVIGVCVGTDGCSAACDAPSQCHTAVCNTASGRCTTPLKPDLTPCDDGSAATSGDVCRQGVCSGVARCQDTSCAASDACHAPGTCDPLTGLCTDPVRPDGTWCDDGVAVSVNDACVSGICRGSVSCGATACAAAGQCQTASCSGSRCVQLSAPDGTRCNDGSAVTVDDTCAGGVCVGRDPCATVVCSASDQCHAAGTCVGGVCSDPLRPDETPCDDENAATVGDRCLRGVCTGVDPCVGVSCPPSDVCHWAGVCGRDGLCTDPARDDGTPCDDGSPATLGDICSGGVCRGAVVCGNATCTAASQCHTAACTGGAVCVQVTRPDGFRCTDGNERTVGDSCVGGTCVSGNDPCVGVVCRALSQCHEQGACEPKTGKCSNPTRADNTPCDDQDPRTASDRCVRGVCKGAPKCAAASCSASDVCHYTGTCDPLSGLCSDNPKPDGTTCNDGDATTTGDQCVGGHCRGSLSCGQQTCVAAGRCQSVACDGQTCRQLQKADGVTCNDERASTVDDECSAGTCAGRDPCVDAVCFASSQCHDQGTCEPSTGRCTEPLKPDGVLCDDGIATTGNDRCSNGVCRGTPRCADVTCTAVSPCHSIGTCNALTGTCSEPTKPDGAPCSDGDAGTFGDRCVNAVCAGVLTCGGGASACARSSACQSVACEGSVCRVLSGGQQSKCSDGDADTVDDVCQSGVCRGVGRCDTVSCPPPPQCFAAAGCDPSDGLCAVTVLPDGSGCDDGFRSTVDDVCVGGTCRGTDLCNGVVCSPSDGCHTTGVCDPLTGLCSDPQRVDGAACDDGDATTLQDRCRGGVCTGAIACGLGACQPANPKCMFSLCNTTATGAGGVQCVELPRADGAACNDEQVNTVDDACSAGVCVGVDKCAGVSCAPQTACRRQGRCDARTGVCTLPLQLDGVLCSDGDPDTFDDRCVSGSCVGTVRRCSSFAPEGCATGTLRADAAVVVCPGGVCGAEPCCADAGACALSSCAVSTCVASSRCNPATGLCTTTVAPDGTGCDDGSDLTSGDRCTAGGCVGTQRCAGTACEALTPYQSQCLVPACRGSVCSAAPKPDGTPCNDGDDSTVTDVCSGGVCEGVNRCAGVVCNVTGQCYTAGICSPATGACTEPARPSGVPCDDGDAASVNDRCSAGVCLGTVQCGTQSCLSASPQCMVARCVGNRCAELPRADGSTCNDGNVTTTRDACISGVCRGVDLCQGTVCVPPAGPDSQCRRRGLCSPLTGECVHSWAKDGASCDDLNPNTTSDACRQGVCVGLPRCASVTCDSTAAAQCQSTPYCLPSTGSCTSDPLADGQACDDGNANTFNDTCTSGRCGGRVVCGGQVCAAASEPCQSTVCAGSQCVVVAAADGASCSDGDAATLGDSCSAGVCVGVARCAGVTCVDASSRCLVGVCDPWTGLCGQRARADGSPCDDGIPDTANDVCAAGVCRGSVATFCGTSACPPPSLCQLRTYCEASTGRCLSDAAADGTPCNDNDTATFGDTCVSGVCSGRGLCGGVVCFPSSQCHAEGSCNATTGRCSRPFRPDGWPCDDGDNTTAADACSNGVCRGSGRCFSGGDLCSAAPACRSSPGTCDASTALCFYPPRQDGVACDAGVCIGGQCVDRVVCGVAVCTARSQCYVAACQNTTCVDLAKRDGEPCDDGSPATVGDVCIGGRCRGTDSCLGRVCAPVDDCHRPGLCDALTGRCTAPAADDGTDCTFSGARGKCAGGVCRLTCAEFAASQCPSLPAAVLCPAGGCNSAVCCVPRRCSGVTCPPPGPCELSSACDPATGTCAVVTASDGSQCISGGGNGTCSQGVCVASPLVCSGTLCPTAGPCERVSCEASGCVVRRQSDGAACDDGDAGTRNDRCLSGVCSGTSRCSGVVCGLLAPADPCRLAGQCDRITGLCTEPVLPDGTQCSTDGAGTAAPVTGSCSSGVCVGLLDCGGGVVCPPPPLPACRVAFCSGAGGCGVQNRSDGTLCSDFNPATVGDRCTGGICRGQLRCAGVQCVAKDQCHVTGVCDPATGTCSQPPVPDGTPCSDGDPLTYSDQCRAGACVGHATCGGTLCLADDAQCTTPGCSSSGACESRRKPDGAPCDDANDATAGDVCTGGVCAGSASACGAQGARCILQGGLQCGLVQGVCEAATGTCVLLPAPDGAPCRDGDPRSANDVCLSGACTAVVTCGGRDCRAAVDLRCGTAYCSVDAAAGEVCRTSPLPDGTSCPLPQMQGVCRNGACTAAPVQCRGPCEAAGNCTYAGVCDAVTGECLPPRPLPEGSGCDDGRNSTEADRCVAGVCVGGVRCGAAMCVPSGDARCQTALCVGGVCSVANWSDNTPCGPAGQRMVCRTGSCVRYADLCANVVCAPTDQCHAAGRCDPLTGLCSDPVVPDGASCDDNDAVTLEDSCRNGTCVGTVVCGGTLCTAAEPQCRAPRCNSTLPQACSSVPRYDGTSCNDGSADSTRDRCMAGVCSGVVLCRGVVCPAPGPCRLPGVCLPLTGRCLYTPQPDGAACDDAAAGVVGGRCFAGACSSVAVCGLSECGNPQPACSLPRCAAAGGCVQAPKVDGSQCDDDNPLTTDDRCNGGACRGVGQEVCGGCTSPPVSAKGCRTAGFCDVVSRSCVYPNAPEGTPCNDGDSSTSSDQCMAGVCVGAVSCGGATCWPAEPQCQRAVCVAVRCVGSVCEGEQCGSAAAPDSTTCDDGDPATVGDVCRSGKCGGESLCAFVQCWNQVDPGRCRLAGGCDPATGLCTAPPAPDGTACTDNSVWTEAAVRQQQLPAQVRAVLDGGVRGRRLC
eukprot:TRINITY_DN1454_c0_g2_i3.p1 TRINITY_DN1454_c0_g2~~TRINITY_DN1454_c0_g2_i3.p1  ORF type:complete len:4987 (+),score=1087.78 TRINITY_DN1454_c0_g2_i3:1191-14963(+)